MYDLPTFLLLNLVRAWRRNEARAKLLIVAGFVLIFGGLTFAIYTAVIALPKEVGYIGWLLFGMGVVAHIAVVARERLLYSEESDRTMNAKAEAARQSPERPELAWDLARAKLELYLERNLYEVRAIFFFTVLVMFAGFVLITYGLTQAFAKPAALDVSLVSAASGVLISFIGGSFMLIYRSVLSQSASYIAILERINAVGMALQIASSLHGDLRAQTTAEVARSLLTIYAPTGTSRPPAG